MKKNISVVVDSTLVSYLNQTAPNNKSKYIEDLIKKDMYEQARESVHEKICRQLRDDATFIKQVADEVLEDRTLSRFIRDEVAENFQEIQNNNYN